MRGFGQLLLPWLLGLIFIVSCSTTSKSTAGDNNKPQPPAAASHMNLGIANKDYSELLAKAQAIGSVRIIVKLDMPFVPEGQLSTSQAAVDQQVKISRMQDQLGAELSKYSVKGIKRFKYTPYMAMEADAIALRALISNPLVMSVQEDAPVPPTSNQTGDPVKSQ